MRCKKGDLALIIKSMAGNEGKVVTCLEYIGHNPGIFTFEGRDINLSCGGDWWRIDRKLNMLQVYNDGIRIIENDHSPFCRDDFMMPIGDKGVSVEEVNGEKLQGTVPV